MGLITGDSWKNTVFSFTLLAYLMAAASLEETEEKEIRSTNHYSFSRGRPNSGGAYSSCIEQLILKLPSVLYFFERVINIVGFLYRSLNCALKVMPVELFAPPLYSSSGMFQDTFTVDIWPLEVPHTHNLKLNITLKYFHFTSVVVIVRNMDTRGAVGGVTEENTLSIYPFWFQQNKRTHLNYL